MSKDFFTKKKIVVAGIVLIVPIIILIVVGWLHMTRVNTEFATEALLEFHYRAISGVTIQMQIYLL